MELQLCKRPLLLSWAPMPKLLIFVLNGPTLRHTVGSNARYKKLGKEKKRSRKMLKIWTVIEMIETCQVRCLEEQGPRLPMKRLILAGVHPSPTTNSIRAVVLAYSKGRERIIALWNCEHTYLVCSINSSDRPSKVVRIQKP